MDYNFSKISLPSDWRVLVTGITSIHGWPVYLELQKLLPPERLFGIGPPKVKKPLEGDNIAKLCMTNSEGLIKVIKEFQPTHVIHCAGVCDLDVCEVRPDWAHAINVEGTATLVRNLPPDAYLMYVSSDLVFSGLKPPKGGYTENCVPDPVSVVGKSYLKAEAVVKKYNPSCIVRVALPLGESFHGDKGAVDWIESRFKKDLPVTLFHDECRSCVSCDEIGHVVVAVLAKETTGLFHFGGDKTWTLHQIGEYVLERGYSPHLLTGMSLNDEVGGPPRVRNISMNSSRLKSHHNEDGD